MRLPHVVDQAAGKALRRWPTLVVSGVLTAATCAFLMYVLLGDVDCDGGCPDSVWSSLPVAARIALVVALLGAVVGATFALHDRIRNWRLGTLLYCLGLAAWVLVNLLADVGRLPLPADIGCDEGMANCGSDGPSWDLVYAAAPLTMATGAVVLAVQAVRRGLDEKRRPMPR